MLEYLRIQNLAIIEDVELEFGPGMCVITGETGAGKSILVGAIAMLRGGRLSRESVRDGAEQAVVEALLRPAVLQAGSEGGEPMTLARVLGVSGRSRQRLDGELITAAELAQKVGPLVDISGQHDGQGLTDPANHRDLLDASGVAEELLAEMRQAHSLIDEVAEELQRLDLDDRDREARLDLLRYHLGELQAIRPAAGEGEALEEERRRLASSVELEEGTRSAVSLLYEAEGCALDTLARASRMVGEAAELDSRLAGASERLVEAQTLVEDVARELRAYAESVDGDPHRLEAVEERLGELRRLCRKHGVDADALVDLQSRLESEMAALASMDERLELLRGKLDQARERGARAAHALSMARREAAERLARAVEANLERLGMRGARFEVRLGNQEARRGDPPERIFGEKRLGPSGWDRVELFIAPNPGEEAHPVARSASGGELSRIMLALKLVISDRDSVVTYVFDEVDAGIGGATADAVGLALAQVSRHRQVVCITHLPAIAAFADQHFRVDKRLVGGRTLASISLLAPREREEEVARMLGGGRVTKVQREAAAELIRSAQARRKVGGAARKRRGG